MLKKCRHFYVTKGARFVVNFLITIYDEKVIFDLISLQRYSVIFYFYETALPSAVRSNFFKSKNFLNGQSILLLFPLI